MSNDKTNEPACQLTRVSNGQLCERKEIVIVDGVRSSGMMSRRGFLGASITAAAALMFLDACGRPTINPNVQRMPFAHEDSVNSVCISPDGKLLASGSNDQTIKLWNLSECTLRKTLKGPQWATEVLSVFISHDGN